jgi:dihydrodipicolinate synthase/N-acetylneuraminate lyase
MTLAAVFPPMVTPFVDGEVDVRAIGRNVTRWMQAGLGGVVALGTNGEAALLDDGEADRVLAAVRQGVPAGRVVIAGTGRESTRAAIAASQRAAALGADFALVRTPSFFRSQMTPPVLVSHFRAVADASPIPVLLYNFPGQTGVNFTPETVAALAEHPNIAGMKETGTDAAQLAAFVDAASSSAFSVLVGAAPGFYPAMCVGAVGGIVAVACVLPELCVKLHTLARDGRHAEARALQRQLTPLGRMVTTTYGVPGLKAAMDAAGFCGGAPRAPLAPVSPRVSEEIRAELARVLEVA